VNIHLFHTWKYCGREHKSTFLGEPITYVPEQFRKCVRCGIVQEFTWDSGGGWWETLSKQCRAIFDRKVTEEIIKEAK
jgi:hypothetical protein